MICANCDHEQSRHKGGEDGCRKCDLGCTGFELPEGTVLDQDLAELEATDPAVAEASARLAETTAAIVEKAAVPPRKLGDVSTAEWREVAGLPPLAAGESTSARLRRVEQERDELAARLQGSRKHLELTQAELASARTERDGVRSQRDEALAHANVLGDGLIRAASELASAHAELEQLRAALRNTATAYIATTTEAASPIISQLTRYLCETCGARYGQPFTDHEHGPLTPVVITMTRKGAS